MSVITYWLCGREYSVINGEYLLDESTCKEIISGSSNGEDNSNNEASGSSNGEDNSNNEASGSSNGEDNSNNEASGSRGLYMLEKPIKIARTLYLEVGKEKKFYVDRIASHLPVSQYADVVLDDISQYPEKDTLLKTSGPSALETKIIFSKEYLIDYRVKKSVALIYSSAPSEATQNIFFTKEDYRQRAKIIMHSNYKNIRLEEITTGESIHLDISKTSYVYYEDGGQKIEFYLYYEDTSQVIFNGLLKSLELEGII